MSRKEHFLPMKGTVFLNAIKNGSKKFEGRVHASKCQQLQKGDLLKLYDNRAKWGILCEIVSKDIYPDFRSMLEDKGILALLPQLTEDAKRDSQEELMRKALKIYHGFPGSNRVEKFGAVAIGVKWIKNI